MYSPQRGEADYVAPGYVVDFASPMPLVNAMMRITRPLSPRDGAMRLLFDDNGGGKCDDPLPFTGSAGGGWTALFFTTWLCWCGRTSMTCAVSFVSAPLPPVTTTHASRSAIGNR